MKKIYVISIGFTLTEIFAQSVFSTKKEAVKALRENKYKWSKDDNCFVCTHYHLTRCAKIESFILNEFNN